MKPVHGVVLEFQSIRHEYSNQGRESLLAIQDVSFTVHTGEVVSLIGPSGCGKSTLIRLAAGLIHPASGSVRVLGGDPEQARAKHAISVVFQQPALLPWRSALGNVTLAGELAGLDKAAQLARARSVLELVGLSGFEEYVPSRLSGGMQQRVALARALMLNPQLLLMDEPFSALDHITRERLQADFSSAWKAAAVAGLLVTHDVQEAVFMSDHAIILTDRPARIAGVVEIPGERPRREDFRSSALFFELCCSARSILQSAFSIS